MYTYLYMYVCMYTMYVHVHVGYKGGTTNLKVGVNALKGGGSIQ